MRKAKLVCTIGPASRSGRIIEKMIQTGMNMARLNFSHGTREEHAEVIKVIRNCSVATKTPVAVLIDLPGPKPRTGKLKKKRIHLRENDEILLTGDRIIGDEKKISVEFPTFFNNMRTGDLIFINDGAIQLKVLTAQKNEAKCIVVTGGFLSDNKGINLPRASLDIPSVTIEDLKNITFAIEHEVDFIGISFVRSVDDILAVKKLLRESRANISIVAKIEKCDALNDIDRIIKEADGIMIARGDLGIEIPLKRVPIVQKEIIRKCNRVGKPVIVATQMLASMVGSARPTRAEVSDVANAVLDGTDAVMLSDETAVGKYPVKVVTTMVNIINEAEKALPYENILLEKSRYVTAQTEDAISYAACHMAQQLEAKCILAYTTSGSTALRVAKYRPRVPILAITPSTNTASRLILSWGIEPHLAVEPSSIENMFQQATKIATQTGIVKQGELVIITAGIPMGTPGNTNVVKVHQVE